MGCIAVAVYGQLLIQVGVRLKVDWVESKMQVAIFNIFTELISKCGNR